MAAAAAPPPAGPPGSAPSAQALVSRDAFLDPAFDPSTFVSDLRKHVPLEQLRNELNKHFQSLRNELLELINRDFDQFVSLSTNLVGADRMIAQLKQPLKVLREDIAGVQDAVVEQMRALQGKLDERKELAEQRSYLQLFINIATVVQHIEERLRSDEWEGSGGGRPAGIDDTGFDVDGRELDETGIIVPEGSANRELAASRLIERVANEYNRLDFYLKRAKDLPFARSLDTRVLFIEKTIRDRLEETFAAGLESGDQQVLSHCLRAFAAIDATSHAENLVRKLWVQPAMQKIIRKERFERANEGLAAIYDDIIRYVQDKFDTLIELTGGESAQSSSGGVRGFNFLANSLWAEVEEVLSNATPFVFATGIPDSFHQNYLLSMAFLDRVERFCKTRESVQAFRNHAAYSRFLRRWGLRVYFQLRFYEVSSKLDAALSRGVEVLASPSPAGYRLDAGAAVEEATERCLAPEVFLPMLAHQFAKLALQCIARYKNWLTAGLQQVLSGAQSGAAAPQAGWAALAPEQYILAYHDTELLLTRFQSRVPAALRKRMEALSGKLPEDFGERLCRESAESVRAVLPELSKIITSHVLSKCLENLQAVRGVTAMYRMTNKPPPTKPSMYVATILQPLGQFAQEVEASSLVSRAVLQSWTLAAVTSVADRYNEMTTELITTVRKTESSLKRLQAKKPAAGPAAPASAQAMGDTDKICLQLYLDVEELGRLMKKLGVEAASLASFASLHDLVYAESEKFLPLLAQQAPPAAP
eukprot:tig00020614_g12236.t1